MFIFSKIFGFRFHNILIYFFQSPYWYMKNDRQHMAEKSLLKILGKARAHKKDEILESIKMSRTVISKPSLAQQVRQTIYL